MGKKHYDFVLEEVTMKNLRTFIFNTQGDLKKGALSKWVEIAVNNLTAGNSAHARSTQNSNPYHIPKGQKKFKDMMFDICDQYVRSGLRLTPVNAGMTIPLKHLEQLVRDVTGHHDDRTIEHHIHDLRRYGYITDKGLTGAFLILDTGTDEEWIERVMEKQKRDERNKKQDPVMEVKVK